MTKEEFISNKMKILVGKEGYNRSQAYAVALNYWDKENKQKAQQGTSWYDNNPYFGNNFNPTNSITIEGTPQEENTGYIPSYGTNQRAFENREMNSREMFNPETGNYFDNYDENGNAMFRQPSQQTSQQVGTPNPFSGVSFENALNYAGRGFGEKDAYKATVGTGLLALKGARNFLSGFATGKRGRENTEDYFKNLYEDQRIPTALQQGGKYKNSEVLAMNAVTDNPNGNVNVESEEFIKRTNGMVQPVVGEKHVKNGKLADGVDVELNNGDKVLSNYIKLRPNDIKELKERYKISLKKGDTPAKALQKIEAKIGLKKETGKLAESAEKLEKALKIKDETTRELSINTLKTIIATQNEKINNLKEVSAVAFDELFEAQEKVEKKGDGTQIFDKNGKEVTETEETVAQQGGINMMGYDNYEDELKSRAPQKPVKRVLYNVGTNEVKEGSLPPGQYTKVEYADNSVDYLDDAGYENFKRMNNFRIYQEQQNRPKTNAIASMQEGGVYDLANKYGISPERANQLISMQMGGEMEQQPSQEEQIVQAVMQMLQEGATPEQIVEQLIQSGVPEEFAVQAVEMVIQQEGETVNQQGEAPQQSMEMAQQGGEKIYAQEGIPSNYTFSTRYTPKVAGYDVNGISIIPQDTLSDVESTQKFTGQGYGQKMADVNKFVDTHSWYFDTEEKKNKFKEAVKKEGQQQEIVSFQNAYNNELRKRAQKVGIPKEEENRLINELGFSGKGVQKYDGLYGAFTSTRPLVDFKKTDGEVKVEVKPVEEQTVQEETIQPQIKARNSFPMLPQDLRLPPSGIPPLLKSEIALGRIEPIKMTPEPMLAEQARQQLTANEQLQATGLPPQIQQALQAQNLASGQMASNDAIAKVEQFNTGQQFTTDQFNIGQRAKEDISNQQFAQSYQDKMLSSMANTERDYRAYLTEGNLQNKANWKSIENANLLNRISENYKYTPGQGVEYIPSVSSNIGNKYNLTPEQLANMTPEQLNNYMRNYTNMQKKATYTQNQQTI